MRKEDPEAFFKTITNGEKPMPAWQKKLTPRERWDSLFYVWSLATSPQRINAGKQIYDANCTPCHGEDGNGKGPRAKNLKKQPTDFTDREHMVTHSDKSMFDTITDGEKPMPSFKTKLSEDDRWNVIDYLWTFVYKQQP